MPHQPFLGLKMRAIAELHCAHFMLGPPPAIQNILGIFSELADALLGIIQIGIAQLQHFWALQLDLGAVAAQLGGDVRLWIDAFEMSQLAAHGLRYYRDLYKPLHRRSGYG